MSYNLRNRSFLKELDFEPVELRHLLKVSEALKTAKYAGNEVKRLEGRQLTTVEWLGDPRTGEPDALQDAFARLGAVQCGYCTPGILLAAHALLAENATPTEADVRRGLAGNLCRCTGYVKIVEAVLAAARQKA